MQRYAGQPFALVGVSADESAELIRQHQQKWGLTWPSIWDGPGGAIATAWKVDRYPTVVLLDQKGVIRWRYAGLPAEGEAERRIDELLGRAVP